MAQNTSSDQNASVADLEAELAASRERLARNIDELVYRAQPKTIMAQQKSQLRAAFKSRYAAIMGTDQGDSYTRTGEAQSGPSLKETVAGKAEELKAQAAAKAEELKAQAAAKLPNSSSDDAAGTRASFKSERDGEGGDLMAQARVKTDQARLKLDELTHTEEGELRTDRVAAGLAGLGAVLVAVGAAQRGRN